MALEDILHPFRGMYRTSPAWFKRSLGLAYAVLPMRLRYGAVLAKTRRLLDQSQWWSYERHREHQWQQMERLIHHACHNVPYYRRALTQAGIDPQDIRSQDDWFKLPLLTKDLIRLQKDELVADNMRGKLLPTNTGGSTGQPLEFYWERGRTRSMVKAFHLRHWAWAGFQRGDRTAIIRGQKVKEGLWHFDPIDNQLFINAYNLSDDNAHLILDKLRRFRPKAIQAYPSTLTLLATWMKHRGEAPIEGVKTLLCGSENLYPAQKKLLEDVFQVRVYGWYGHGEVCCLAGFCESTDYYHVYSEYGYVELVDETGNPLAWKEGNKGEIVGTSLVNNAMPFIRYRTGDVAVVGPGQCPCGRRYPLIAAIEGRRQEYIITADGRAISLTALVFGQHWHAFADIAQLQLEQNQPGNVIVRIVKHSAYTSADESEIREKMIGAVGSGLELTFEYVDYIPPTDRGKHVFLKQSLASPGAWAADLRLEHQPPSPSRTHQDKTLRGEVIG